MPREPGHDLAAHEHDDERARYCELARIRAWPCAVRVPIVRMSGMRVSVHSPHHGVLYPGYLPTRSRNSSGLLDHGARGRYGPDEPFRLTAEADE